MKIRRGFVSNSSSSSFIVAFPDAITCKDDIRRMVFGDDDFFENLYYHPKQSYSDGPPGWPVEQCVDEMWNQIKNKNPNNMDEIIREFRGGDTEHLGINCNNYKGDNGRINWDRYNEAITKEAKKQSKQFWDSNPGSKIYIFEFCDNEGHFYTALEHGDVFRRLPYVRISKH